jgi:hypothetical protein
MNGMPTQNKMLNQIAEAMAKADGSDLRTNADRYRRLAVAALKALTKPTDAMVDAAHEAVSFDDLWAINSRADFRKAVRAMMLAATKESCRQDNLVIAPTGNVSPK